MLNHKKKKLLILITLIIVFNISCVQTPGKIYKENNKLLYMVKQGDTLFSISNRFKNSIDEIRNLNPEINANLLQLGDIITLNIKTDLKFHIVKVGDTLWKISKKYNYPLTQVINFNNLSNPDLLIPNEVIIIPDMYKKVRSVLYFLKFTTTSAFLVPEERMIPVTHNFYSSVIEELIKGPKYNNDTFIPTIPETKVLNLYVKDSIAYLNFSEEILKASLGSTGEALLLNAITNSISEFREIKGVYILINGKSGGSIGGHIELNEPIRRDLSMVRY